MRAFVEAIASVSLWFQYLVMQVYGITRAATCSGSDLDSWMYDFNLTRLTAVSATGLVTFARFGGSVSASIPVGTVVSSHDGSKMYTVTADTSNAHYDSGTNSYVMAIGDMSVNVPVTSSNTGSSGNAIIGEINTINNPIPNVDTVTNAAAITNGLDTETDAAYRKRFVAYIASLFRATIAAVGEAITSTQVGLSYIIVENYSYAGAVKNGFFFAVVDDGSGSPPSGLLDQVRVNVELMRPLCVGFEIHAPVIVNASVVMSITVAAGDGSAERTLATTAIKNYINSTALGTNLNYTSLSSVVYASSPNIVNVIPGYTLNGVTADLTITNKQIVKAGTIEVY